MAGKWRQAIHGKLFLNPGVIGKGNKLDFIRFFPITLSRLPYMGNQVFFFSRNLFTLLLLGIWSMESCTAYKNEANSMEEIRNEIILLLKEDSGVSVDSGKFSSHDSELVTRVNQLLKEHQGEVRKIGIPEEMKKSLGSASYSGFYQVYISGNKDEILRAFKNESWIESAYWKPKSEDPGSF